MTKVIDLRGQTMGGQDKRSTIKNIARHHSATEQGDVFTFERHWKNARGWNTGGYHEIILRDGTVQLCYDSNVVSNGVYGHNTTTYHICLVGNGNFTEAQEKAFKERANYNLKRFGLKLSNVKGHNEFSGTNTSCPGIDMNEVRKSLTEKSTPEPQKNNISVDGLWGSQTTKALQKALGTVRDGVISNQLKNDVTKMIVNGITFGKGGSLVVKALQKKVGAKVDGYLGQETISKLQKYLGTPIDGKISKVSPMVKELQKQLNKGTF